MLGFGRAKRRAGLSECGGGLFVATSGCCKSGSRLLGFGFESIQGRVGVGESVDQVLAPLMVAGGAVSVRLGSFVVSRQLVNLVAQALRRLPQIGQLGLLVLVLGLGCCEVDRSGDQPVHSIRVVFDVPESPSQLGDLASSRFDVVL